MELASFDANKQEQSVGNPVIENPVSEMTFKSRIQGNGE